MLRRLHPTFCLKEAMSKSPPADDQSEEAPDLFSLMDRSSLPVTSRRVIESSAQIRESAPERADFLHAVLCQVGMPRKQSKTRVFERSSGTVSMRLEAGTLFQRGKFVDQPLPYGTRPRLVMVHISGEAVRTGSREVHVGDSMREFLITLSIEPSGGPRGGYTMFKKQMEALAASRLTLGMSVRSRDVTINTQPISRFEAWLTHDGKQRGLWPGVMELSQEFYDTLTAHAVPLDHRALGALKHSALALDIYTWLAHRLCRIKKPEGVMVSWGNMRDQFGQEYSDPKNFKRKFRQAMREVCAVYPHARIEDTNGGLILHSSKPPIAKTSVLVGAG